MLYDISPPLSPGLAVWPGDVPLTRVVQSDIRDGAEVTLSALNTTAHLGAHADAPSHCVRDGVSIDQCDLRTYLGPCQVIRVAVGRGEVVMPAAAPEPLRAARVLLATGSVPDPAVFRPDYAALSIELADRLCAQGVTLVGVDTPSVDRFGDDALPVHRRLLRHGVSILEGLALADVPDGVYELIALPLRLVGFDASPVRAVLRTIEITQVRGASHNSPSSQGGAGGG